MTRNHPWERPRGPRRGPGLDASMLSFAGLSISDRHLLPDPSIPEGNEILDAAIQQQREEEERIFREVSARLLPTEISLSTRPLDRYSSADCSELWNSSSSIPDLTNQLGATSTQADSTRSNTLEDESGAVILGSRAQSHLHVAKSDPTTIPGRCDALGYDNLSFRFENEFPMQSVDFPHPSFEKSPFMSRPKVLKQSIGVSHPPRHNEDLGDEYSDDGSTYLEDEYNLDRDRSQRTRSMEEILNCAQKDSDESPSFMHHQPWKAQPDGGHSPRSLHANNLSSDPDLWTQSAGRLSPHYAEYLKKKSGSRTLKSELGEFCMPGSTNATGFKEAKTIDMRRKAFASMKLR